MRFPVRQQQGKITQVSNSNLRDDGNRSPNHHSAIELISNEIQGSINNGSPSTSTTNNVKKRYKNLSMQIVGGKRYYSDSQECYQFAQSRSCQAGIFCPYLHGGNNEHSNVRVCFGYSHSHNYIIYRYKYIVVDHR